MNALILKPRVRQSIALRVDKILRELDYPEPPLDLSMVRELLVLDRSYFSSEARGLLAMTASRLRRGGKQLLSDPTVVADAIKKFDLRAFYLPKQKKILIDDSLPVAKHRWLEAHEIGHSLLPWHQDMMLGDDEITPTSATHDRMEAEANFAGGSLIFLNDKFVKECKDVKPTIQNALKLKKRYGNTITTTLWRMIEHTGEDRPLLGLIGPHPRQIPPGTLPFRHVIPSSAFGAQFDLPSIDALIREIQNYSWGSKGPIGSAELILTSKTRVRHAFRFETFFNNWDALTLGVHIGPVPTIVSLGSYEPVAA